MTLMALSGLHIPAKPYSEIAVFTRVFADIGDEQSIEMSLSTFSSHMLHIKQALDNAGSESLILFDELGGGTDPKEGVALGEAIIDQLITKEAKAIVTTHHGALKMLASEYPQVRNACMEFDSETLTPTYRFQIGYPAPATPSRSLIDWVCQKKLSRKRKRFWGARKGIWGNSWRAWRWI